MSRQNKIKVRIWRDLRRTGLVVLVMREVNDPDSMHYEVLASNGKWREKSDAAVIFEDEKHTLEGV